MNHLNVTEPIHPAAAREPHACASELEHNDGPILFRDTAEESAEELSPNARRTAKPTSVTQEVLPPDPYAHLRPMAAARVIRETTKVLRNVG